MSQSACDLGLVGLGTMGRNLLFNMADHGFSVIGYDKDEKKVETLCDKSKYPAVHSAYSAKDLVAGLKKPRAVLVLVPAGKIVDYVIHDLVPHLDEGDIIIDGGNSHFSDTNRRQKDLATKNIHFLGLGISGGAKGARTGPSMMPGGEKEAYQAVENILSAVAAKVKNEPCVTYLGKSSAGHYVKMVHNGIEYGIMELISETYDIMKRGLGMTNDEIHKTFATWNEGELNSYLLEISAKIFTKKDEETGEYVIDLILDASKSKGTGKWTTQDALNLKVPPPTIDSAVAARDMSGYKEEREAASKIFSGPDTTIDADKTSFLEQLKNALYFSYILTYAQGMEVLQEASKAYDYDLNLSDVAKIWRGGCIIRATLLEGIMQAFKDNNELVNLMMADNMSDTLQARQADCRAVVQLSIGAGIPVSALVGSLTYFDSYRTSRLPANLVQAQRDFFGSHTYERIDKAGKFHTEWED